MFAAERAQPPAVQALGVPLHDRQHIAPAKAQLIRRLRGVVVQSLGQEHALRERHKDASPCCLFVSYSKQQQNRFINSF